MPHTVTDRESLTRGLERPMRRSRLLRSIIALAAMAAGLLVFLAWQRDTYHTDRQRKDLGLYCAALQKELDRLGQLPASPPTVPGSVFEKSAYLYFDDAARYYARRTDRPVIVMVAPMLTGLLKASGRSIIILEAKKLRVEWMSEQQFLEAWHEQRNAARTQSG